MNRLITAILFTLLVFSTSYNARAHEPIRIASLPNPNLLSIFVIMDKGIENVEVVPARDGVSSIVGLIRAKKADAAVISYETVSTLSDVTGFRYVCSNISEAVHILSYKEINSTDDLKNLQIVASFRGGSPDILYRRLNAPVKPVFTDPFVAINLFVKKEYDALLLPEPLISAAARMLEKKGMGYNTFSVKNNITPAYTDPVNAVIAKDAPTAERLRKAYKKATEFIRENPDEAVAIFNENFEKHYNRKFNSMALLKALKTGRLMFEYSDNAQD